MWGIVSEQINPIYSLGRNGKWCFFCHFADTSILGALPESTIKSMATADISVCYMGHGSWWVLWPSITFLGASHVFMFYLLSQSTNAVDTVIWDGAHTQIAADLLWSVTAFFQIFYRHGSTCLSS